jgi:phage repressor protein C with HTH and peptisase S24 domain
MKKIERFDKYMEFKGLNDNKVTTQVGLSTGTIGKSRKPNRDLSDKVVEQILNFYTDLNRAWLLAGEGEMLNPQPTATINAPNHGLIAVGNHTTNTYNTTTPATETEDIPEAEVAVIPTELYKDPNTNLYQYTEVNDVETQPIVHQFSPHDRFYRVINSSMSPKLLASDVVALQRVDINDSIPGCVYMIDHRTKGSFLRKVTDQGDSLLLSSYNKEDYPDFVVHKKDVLNLARVVGLIRTDI